MEDKKEILSKCSIDKNGDVTCNVTQEKFDEIQKNDIKPKKIVFEID